MNLVHAGTEVKMPIKKATKKNIYIELPSGSKNHEVERDTKFSIS